MKSITEYEIRELAMSWGLEYSALRAVIEVESAGSGFFLDSDGVWKPKILFEAHYMWKRLQARGINPALLNQYHPDLCHKKWDPKTYPYGTTSQQYTKILNIILWAQKHYPDKWESYKKAAYESASWGAMQVMGANYAECGYANIYDFKHAMEVSEKSQIEISLKWMRNNGLLKKLQNKQWTLFAAGYNGIGKVMDYSKKLRTAYSKYS